jgi:hypothetical protein
MILAGEEFGDEHDLFDRHGNVTHQGGKQVDPVNYSRFDEPDRKDLSNFVAKLIKLRTSHPSLAADEVFFFHIDSKRASGCWSGAEARPATPLSSWPTSRTIQRQKPSHRGQNTSCTTGPTLPQERTGSR